MKNTLLDKVVLSILLVFTSFTVYSQEGNVWTFGAGARMDFTGIGGAPVASTSSISTYEGCASIADNLGNLLFYTNGIDIWDASDVQITDPTTELSGDPSTAQTGIIIPRPGSTSNYYIVSNAARASSVAAFTEVNVTSGVVSIVGTVNMPLPTGPTPALNTTEGMTVAAHCNGTDYWLITHEMGNDVFKSYQVTAAGFVTAPVISNQGPVITALLAGDTNVNSGGCMKISPSNLRLAHATRQIEVSLYDFDPNSGIVSGYLIVPTDDATFSRYYGVEFSPDSEILYYSDLRGGIYSYDIIPMNLRIIENTILVAPSLYGALQLAPDGKIYHAKDGDQVLTDLNETSLGVISDPNDYLGATYDPLGFPLALGTACKVGLPNIIPALSSPSLAVSGDTEICVGESTTLEVSGGVTYEWSPADYLNTSTGSTVIASPPSTQTYTITSTVDGCVSTFNVTIVVENCCPLLANPPADIVYHYSNETINSDTYWSGTHYIANDVIINVANNAVLDITNVDVVFDECAGIDFTNGAMLRSNNSVYRPCNIDKTWRGLHFYAGGDTGIEPSAIINECTFKNAQRAVYAYNQDQIDIRVTNNLFSNCKASISFRNGQSQRSITGNTFMLDDLLPDFSAAECSWGATNEFYGIITRRIQFEESISQNDFIAPDFSTINFTGIESIVDRNIAANSNRFTNTYRAINMFRTANATIESNEINVTQDYVGFEHQIAMNRCSNALISSNQVINSTNYSYTSWSGNNSGIHCYLGSSFEIKENYVEGFETGIQCERQRNTSVIDNEIKNCYFYGIYFNNMRNSQASCNLINMEDQEGQNAVGIGYLTPNLADVSNRISSNCIFETDIAIYTEGTSVGTSQLPEIKNNYLYNYSTYGVQVINMNGDIGSSPSPALGAGQNTFVSNNGLGLIADITSTFPLTSFGNFGVSFVSGTISIAGNNVNSTASCGTQIDLANSGNGYIQMCDNLSAAIQGILDDNMVLKTNYETAIPDANIDELIHCLHVLHNTNLLDFETFYEKVLMTKSFIGNDRQWFSYTYAFLTNNNVEELNVLNSIDPINEDEATFIAILKINSDDELNAEEIVVLEAVAETNSIYAHLATSILYYHDTLNTRTFESTKKIKTNNANVIIEISPSSFTFYPNPTNREIFFEYSLEKFQNANVFVFDINGKLVFKKELGYEHHSQVIDLSDLPSGVYTISLQTEEGTLQNSKLIKI